jgi:hypothetical protein
MTGRSGGSEGPEDVDAAFAEIVAGLEREGLGARWSELLGPDAGEREDRRPADDQDTSNPPGRAWAATPAAEEPADEDHYVPPEPPPFPRLRAGTIVALVLFGIGVLLLAAPGLIGIAPRVATPLALIALSCGIGWLVLRMRSGPPTDSGPDDGAQL